MSVVVVLIQSLLVASGFAVAALAIVLLIEVLAAGPARPRRVWAAAADRGAARSPGPVAVLIPAHDEAVGIAATLASLRPQLQAGDRLLVVADNCSDDTAAVARAAGAEVVERVDVERRGKGYALDFGVKALASRPPAFVLIVDADCEVLPDAVAGLRGACQALERPVQARYLLYTPGRPAVPGTADGAVAAQEAGTAPAIGAGIAELAIIVKNWVRPKGLARLGLPCPLLGSGMMFPWPVLASAPLASGNIVEDMQLGVELTARGQGPLFIEEAQVRSPFPSSDEGQRGQRRRWEHGHLQTLLAATPRLLARGLGHMDRSAVALALDLAVPPLALLVMGGGMVSLLALVNLLLGGWVLPFVLSAAGLLMIGIAVLLAWSRYARERLPAAVLWRAPAYALAKIPVYLGFLRGRQTEWVRARRDHERD